MVTFGCERVEKGFMLFKIGVLLILNFFFHVNMSYLLIKSSFLTFGIRPLKKVIKVLF
jgi:hypothetical protein